MKKSATVVEHAIPSPFPRPSSGGGLVVDEKCKCRHRRSSHWDTEIYGGGACGTEPMNRPCRCQQFEKVDNFYKHREVGTRATTHRGLRNSLGRGSVVAGKLSVEGKERRPGRSFRLADLRMGQPSHTKGSVLGVGCNPSYAVAARIQTALDPTQAPGPVKTLAQMTEQEREQFQAPILTPVGEEPEEWKPSTIDLEGLRLGPEFLRKKWLRKEEAEVPTRLLFAISPKWRSALRRAGVHLHARMEQHRYAYPLDEERWKKALSWGVRSANRVEQALCFNRFG